MHKLALLLLVIASASAQQIDVLKADYPGRILRDNESNWILVQDSASGLGLRVVKLNAEFSQTLFDRRFTSSFVTVADVRVDSSGNLSVLGANRGGEIATTPGALWPSPAPIALNAFLIELDSAGQTLLSTYLAPETDLSASGFIQNSQGEWLIGGQTCLPIAAKGVTIQGSGCLVVLRISPDATRLAGGMRFGSPQNLESIAGMAADPDGDLFLAGTTSADDFPATSSAYLGRRPGGLCTPLGFGPSSARCPCPSGFVARLDGADLHVKAATYLGGKARATLAAVAVDGKGFPYVAGTVTTGQAV